MENISIIGTRLKKFREINGITQKNLAELLGVSIRQIVNIENCDTIKPLYIEIISTKYNLNKTWLLTGVGEMMLNNLHIKTNDDYSTICETNQKVIFEQFASVLNKAKVANKMEIIFNLLENANKKIDEEVEIENLISKIGIDLNQQQGWSRLLSAFGNFLILKDDTEQLKAKMIFTILDSLPVPTSPEGAKEELIHAFENIKYEFPYFPADFANRKEELISLVKENFDDLDAYTFLVRKQQVFSKICEIVGFKADGIVKQEKLSSLR